MLQTSWQGRKMKLNNNLKDKSIKITDAMNSFLEKEILVYDAVTKFKECSGYMRRGVPGYHLSVPRTMEKYISAKAFERECWPRVEKSINGIHSSIMWYILYEDSKSNYESSFQISIGYQFDHDLKGQPDEKRIVSRLEEIKRKPFFISGMYHVAEQKGNTFSSIDGLICRLKENISKIDYRKRERT